MAENLVEMSERTLREKLAFLEPHVKMLARAADVERDERKRAEADRDALAERVKFLREVLGMLRSDAAAEMWRRRNPGGQQAGVPRLSGVPLSMLMEWERDLRHALEEDERRAALTPPPSQPPTADEPAKP